MADKNHVEIIAQGAKAIEDWRMKNPELRLDLRHASFRRADLTHLNLNRADFREANLEWADLRWADLIEADLSGTNLTRADFHKADLRHAKLCKADFTMANFEDANLNGADCSEAIFSGTRLLNTDLSSVSGLETTSHPSNSTIDQETLDKTNELPIKFLRGCGLSDQEIRAAIKSLVSAEVFSDFLEKASYLLSEGYKDPAAVMIGSVLEQKLRQLCQRNDIETVMVKERKKIPKKSASLNAELFKAGVYNQLDQKNITAWLELRNNAAHGHYDKYTDEQVSIMLKSVYEFIVRMHEKITAD